MSMIWPRIADRRKDRYQTRYIGIAITYKHNPGRLEPLYPANGWTPLGVTAPPTMETRSQQMTLVPIDPCLVLPVTWQRA